MESRINKSVSDLQSSTAPSHGCKMDDPFPAATHGKRLAYYLPRRCKAPLLTLCYVYSGSNYVSCHYIHFNPLHCTPVIDSWHQSASKVKKRGNRQQSSVRGIIIHTFLLWDLCSTGWQWHGRPLHMLYNELLEGFQAASILSYWASLFVLHQSIL